jgi:hypothetical protein
MLDNCRETCRAWSQWQYPSPSCLDWGHQGLTICSKSESHLGSQSDYLSHCLHVVFTKSEWAQPICTDVYDKWQANWAVLTDNGSPQSRRMTTHWAKGKGKVLAIMYSYSYYACWRSLLTSPNTKCFCPSLARFSPTTSAFLVHATLGKTGYSETLRPSVQTW